MKFNFFEKKDKNVADVLLDNANTTNPDGELLEPKIEDERKKDLKKLLNKVIILLSIVLVIVLGYKYGMPLLQKEEVKPPVVEKKVEPKPQPPVQQPQPQVQPQIQVQPQVQVEQEIKEEKHEDFLDVKNNSIDTEILKEKRAVDTTIIKMQQEEIEKNVNIIKNKNKEEITTIANQLKLYEEHIGTLTKNIENINTKFSTVDQKMGKFNNSNYITDEELKLYFKQNNTTLSELISKKFEEIEKRVATVEHKSRINTLHAKTKMNTSTIIKENIKAKEIKEIEFEYLGFDTIENNGKKEKMAFIAKSGSEKIYTVSLNTEIEKKYIIQDVDSSYLYIKLLSDNQIYKLAILE